MKFKQLSASVDVVVYYSWQDGGAVECKCWKLFVKTSRYDFCLITALIDGIGSK